MYGVMAGQKHEGRARTQKKEQPPPDEKIVRLTLRERLMNYVEKRFNPPPEEEYEEVLPPRPRPEPPATLAKTTRFTTHEIKLMYRGFKQECPSGVVDEASFKHIFCQLFPLGDASQYARLVFNTIKHKQNGKVTFEEYLDILSQLARGSTQEKLSWVFTLYDVDGDGRISRNEMVAVVTAIYELLGDAVQQHQEMATEHVDRIFHLMDTDSDGAVSPEELWGWCRAQPALLRSLHALDTQL